MFNLFDPFGFGKRREELMAPYVRPSDNALTKKAIYLALTEKNFANGNTGVQILKNKLGKDEMTVKCMLLKLHRRGVAPATSVCETMDWIIEERLRKVEEAEDELRRILMGSRRNSRGPGAGWDGCSADDGDDDGDEDGGGEDNVFEELEELDDQEP